LGVRGKSTLRATISPHDDAHLQREIAPRRPAAGIASGWRTGRTSAGLGAGLSRLITSRFTGGRAHEPGCDYAGRRHLGHAARLPL